METRQRAITGYISPKGSANLANCIIFPFILGIFPAPARIDNTAFVRYNE